MIKSELVSPDSFSESCVSFEVHDGLAAPNSVSVNEQSFLENIQPVVLKGIVPSNTPQKLKARRLLSLLRYAGAKPKMLPIIRPYLDPLLQKSEVFHDVFAGGLSLTLDVARRFPNMRICVNDLDANVYAVWSLCIDGSDDEVQALFNLIDQEPTVELFKSLKNSTPRTRVEWAYRCIYINRTARSGILTAGCIGGYKQNGKYKITDRYNAHNIKKAFLDARFLLRHRTVVTSANAVDYLAQPSGESDVYYLDPPYFVAGRQLYPTHMSVTEHYHLAEVLKHKPSNWVLSYDCCEEIESLYRWANKATLSTYYTVNKSRSVRQEYLITPPDPAQSLESKVLYSSGVLDDLSISSSSSDFGEGGFHEHT